MIGTAGRRLEDSCWFMIILRTVSSTDTKLHILRRFSLSVYYLSITSFLYNSSTPILKQIHTGYPRLLAWLRYHNHASATHPGLVRSSRQCVRNAAKQLH
jgi:hypothetical protein